MAMLNFNDLLEAVEHLSHEEKRTLKQRLEELEGVDTIASEPTIPLKPRTPNLHPGSVWMSDDFDAPLPDEFWFGDDE